jgi:hypothetical protein
MSIFTFKNKIKVELYFLDSDLANYMSAGPNPQTRIFQSVTWINPDQHSLMLGDPDPKSSVVSLSL